MRFSAVLSGALVSPPSLYPPCSKPSVLSDGLFEWFRRIRGPAATQGSTYRNNHFFGPRFLVSPAEEGEKRRPEMRLGFAGYTKASLKLKGLGWHSLLTDPLFSLQSPSSAGEKNINRKKKIKQSLCADGDRVGTVQQ